MLGLYPGLHKSCMQRVIVDGTASRWLPVKSGLPQGLNGPGSTYISDLH